MVARKAIESLYDGTCVIHTQRDIQDAVTGVVSYETVTSDAYPCRLSYKTIAPSGGDGVTVASQVVTLFIAPEIVIPVGADIDVVHRGRNLTYKASGIPAVYDTHQEVPLEARSVHNG